jgi:hypothetical protein
MQQAQRVDAGGVSKQHDDRPEVRRLPSEPDRDVVAEAAARLLREADRAVEELRAEAQRAAGDVRGAADAAKARIEVECAAEDLRIAVGAEVRDDRARMDEISRDLERVHGQLDKINSGIIGLQTNSLRQTGVAALALAILIAIAWKVIAG